MVLMTSNDWKKIKYMHHSSETWGAPYKVHKELVFKVERLRTLSGKPTVLTCNAYSKTGHASKSQHSLGTAADLRIKKATLLEMYILAEMLGFNGIGLYPNNGRPFIHVDIRDIEPYEKGARWIAIGDPNNWTYIALNEENLRKYVI